MKSLIKLILNLGLGALIAWTAGWIGALFGVGLIPAFCDKTGTTMTLDFENGRRLFFDPKNNILREETSD